MEALINTLQNSDMTDQNFPDLFQNQDIMHRVDDMINNFNLNNELLCDEECENNQKKEKLYEEYLDAKSNVKTAPEELEKAEAKFLTQDKGISWYTNYKQEKELGVASELADYLSEKFEEQKEKIQVILNNFNTQVGYTDNLGNLLDSYKTRNAQSQEEIEQLRNVNNVSNRMTQYTDQTTPVYNAWNKFFSVLYWLLFAAYVVLIVILAKQFKNKKQWLIVASFVLYFLLIKFFTPFIWTYIHNWMRPLNETKIGNYPDIKTYSSQ